MRIPAPAELMAECTRLAQGEYLADMKAIIRAYADHAKPPERISTVECAEKYRWIRAAKGSVKRKWSLALTPYLKGVGDALDDPKVQEVIVPKPGRVGGTAMFESYLFKLMRFGPMVDVGWYLASDSEVTSYSEGEFKNLFVDHEEIAAKIGSGKSDNNKSTKVVSGRKISVLPANKRTITNRQFGFMVGDEIDSYTPALRSSFLDQARVRGRTLGSDRKVGMASHPDAGWTSGISLAWTESSRGIYVWPCAECGMHSSPFPTRFWPDVPRMNLVYDDAGEGADRTERIAMAKKTAAMMCPHCGALLDDSQRHEMIDLGVWLHQGQTFDATLGVCGEIDDNPARGFWIHGTMSKMVGVSELAAALEGALAIYDQTRNTAKLREVTSKVMGEPYEGASESAGLDGNKLMKRTEAMRELETRPVWYPSGVVPKGPLFLTQAIDVGHKKFDLAIYGWDLEGRSWLIERKTIRQRVVDGLLYDINAKERLIDYQVLVPEINRVVPFQEHPGFGLPIAVTLIDSGDGNVTSNVYSFCTQMARVGWGIPLWRKVRPIKGQRGNKTKLKIPTIPISGTIIDKDDKGKPIQPELRLFNLNVDNLKQISHDRLPVDDGGPGQCYFPHDVTVRQLNELFAEREIDGLWVKGDSPNEGLDLFGYCEAGRLMLEPDRKGRGWGTENIPIWARPVPLGKGPEKLPVSPPAGVRVESQKQANALSLLEQMMSLNNGD